MNSETLNIARAIRDQGGRALIVGGYVRDRLLGIDSKDIDVEVYGIDLDALEALLSDYGEVFTAGRSFGVLRLKSLDIDFSLPRRDSKVATGHRGFTVQFDSGLDFTEAARRRDFTVNSIGLDPLTNEIIDPHGGQNDLDQKVLRATDSDHFAEDPLRALRAAQFIARFGFSADDSLVELCSTLDISELASERIGEEFRKLLLLGQRPSHGLEFLRQTGLLRFFPQLQALIDVPQDAKWHPEGDVWIHTLMVVDEAARLRDGADDDFALMLGALCHDLGKPITTSESDGNIRSPGHDEAGVIPSHELLTGLHTPHHVIKQVQALVRHHLAPALYVQQGTGAKGYRRLARKLHAAHVSPTLLHRVATADHLGRTTAEALARVFPAGDAFLKAIDDFLIEGEAAKRVVTGKHLMERGLRPGPELGKLLARCELVQDETGWDDAEMIIERAMGSPDATD
ncbi:MAG: HD domain-containing protein [Gammaproteobacteria bacterium]|nr:HD domain-containing protein [Gammaproteobacteria bacterium]